MGTTEIRLTTYITKIEALYTTARGAYKKTADEMQKLEERHNEKMRSGELNSIGISKEKERFYAQKKELENAMAEIRNEFTNDVQKVRASVEELFRGNYRATPDSMDLKAVEMIKSGMLSDSELLELAYRYKADGNLAMYRYCGTQIKDAENSHNQNIRNLAIDAHRTLNRDDLALIDTFKDVCLNGMRDDVMLSNGIDQRHEEFYSDIYNGAKDITATISTPWDD